MFKEETQEIDSNYVTIDVNKMEENLYFLKIRNTQYEIRE